MKTNKLIFILHMLFTCPSIVFTQNYLKNHKSLLSYAFDRSYISITNEYAKDTAIKIIPAYIHYPYKSRKIQLYGPSLEFTISPNGYSFDFLSQPKIRSVGGFVMDSIFKRFIETELKKTGRYKWLSKFESDSISKKENRFYLPSMQVRVVKNGQTVINWKNILLLPSVGQDKDSSKAFIVFNDLLDVNDHVNITFRNKQDTSLIKFEFERLGSPLMPYLARYQRDTSSQSLTDFIQNGLEKTSQQIESINQFYRYWPISPSSPDLLGATLKKDRIYTDTKLCLLFRKPDPDYTDTSLEYIMSPDPIKDSIWHTTGHALFLSDFEPGSDYTLLVRYKKAPERIKMYTFHTMPKWYQSTKYKFAITTLIVLLLLGLLLILYRSRLKKEKKKNAYLTYGLKSIRSQLNPHFVFNALSSIQGLINKNDISGANHYLTEFSNLLRESLRNNDKELVPLEIELKILETYLKLEQLRFHFQYRIDIDNYLDRNAVEIPALLLQPLIENAIKHGISTLNEKGEIKIIFSKIGTDLIASVSDNGKGFADDTPTTGLGLKLTKDRILLLNQTMKSQPIELTIESSQNNGTTVHLVFKNWL